MTIGTHETQIFPIPLRKTFHTRYPQKKSSIVCLQLANGNWSRRLECQRRRSRHLELALHPADADTGRPRLSDTGFRDFCCFGRSFEQEKGITIAITMQIIGQFKEARAKITKRQPSFFIFLFPPQMTSYTDHLPPGNTSGGEKKKKKKKIDKKMRWEMADGPCVAAASLVAATAPR